MTTITEQEDNENIKKFKFEKGKELSKGKRKSEGEFKYAKKPSKKFASNAGGKPDWKNSSNKGRPDWKKSSFKGGKPEWKKVSQEDGGKPDWKKVKEERKILKVKRKQKDKGGNEIYEVGLRMKAIWEKLRNEDCEKNQKGKLCKELHTLIKGKVKSLIYAHDTCRVIQTLVNLGGDEIRDLMFSEVQDNIVELCKMKYARNVVIKFLRCGNKEQKNAVINAMKGNVVKLMRHKLASDVLELAYNDYADAKQRSHIKQEFYGPRFRVFKENITTLEEAVNTHPDLKESMLEDIKKALQTILEKGVFTNTLIHTVLKEYMYSCEVADKRDVIESIKEGLLPILHTRDGARVAMMCFWYGTPKERKVMLKSFKGKFVSIALEEFGYLVLLAAFDCIDDTVVVSKVALQELMAEVNQLAENETGKRVLKYLVAPRKPMFTSHAILKVLEQGDDNPHSKKERTVRYKELQATIAKPVLQLIQQNIDKWARDQHWTLFIGSALQSLSFDEAVVPVYQALAEICAEAFIPGEKQHFLEISYMTKMITFIIECDKERFREQRPVFSTHLIETAESELRGWALVNRGCFILVKLIETEIPQIVEKVTEICKPLMTKLSQRSYVGASVLLKKLQC